MDCKSILKIIGINIKHNFVPHLLIALAIALLVPAVSGITSLTGREAARPLEMMLSLTGVVLLAPIFLPEQNENIRDLIRSKRMDYLIVCLMRLVYSVFFLAMICGSFTYIMYCCESETTFRHFSGCFISALFLGALGFFFAGVSRNTIVGYMIAMIYYMANYAMKDELNHFYLFSMSSGSFSEKYWLLGATAVLFAATFMCLKFFRN